MMCVGERNERKHAFKRFEGNTLAKKMETIAERTRDLNLMCSGISVPKQTVGEVSA